VTNQAIQMLTGPYPIAAFSNGVSCQGGSFNLSPFVTKSKSYALPFSPTLTAPVYDTSDANEDGIPDNPGRVLYTDERPSNQKDSHSLSMGISATFSVPLDGGIQERCKAAADAQTALHRQKLANLKLDFELSRLKVCGEQLAKGVRFATNSKYAVICSQGFKARRRAIKARFRSRCASLLSHTDSRRTVFPRKVEIFLITFFTVGLIAFRIRSANGLASSADVAATAAIVAVVMTTGISGSPSTTCSMMGLAGLASSAVL
jgi:hypothetical protein